MSRPRDSQHNSRTGHPAERVLIAGFSVRSAASSAARAGFAATSLDAFGDRDSDAAVTVVSLPRRYGVRFTPYGAVRASRDLPADAVVYLSGFENHPRAVAALARGRTLWGNAPATLRRVRDPFELSRALTRRGVSVATPYQDDGTPWIEPRLMKPVASGGGRRVRPWTAGIRLPRGYYGQQFISGSPGSVLGVAAGGRAGVLGISRQLVGEAPLGATGFQYCGNVLTMCPGAETLEDPVVVEAASVLAATVAEAFNLAGVFGVDFVVRDGVPYVIEVNPRWTGSMELVERACGLSVFAAHVAACRDGVLPAEVAARRRTRVHGKAIVFARRAVVVGDTDPWLDNDEVCDVPWPGDIITAGQPVCTVFAEEDDEAACRGALMRRADVVYQQLAAWPGGSGVISTFVDTAARVRRCPQKWK